MDFECTFCHAGRFTGWRCERCNQSLETGWQSWARPGDAFTQPPNRVTLAINAELVHREVEWTMEGFDNDME